mmetsp:Transcript_6880/g.19402  ORF Transcript_6880/g.19402 Transcript_6880/m.19402 type:complete len:235 (-) Transcript_6880:742-1446(-)
MVRHDLGEELLADAAGRVRPAVGTDVRVVPLPALHGVLEDHGDHVGERLHLLLAQELVLVLVELLEHLRDRLLSRGRLAWRLDGQAQAAQHGGLRPLQRRAEAGRQAAQLRRQDRHRLRLLQRVDLLGLLLARRALPEDLLRLGRLQVRVHLLVEELQRSGEHTPQRLLPRRGDHRGKVELLGRPSLRDHGHHADLGQPLGGDERLLHRGVLAQGGHQAARRRAERGEHVGAIH